MKPALYSVETIDSPRLNPLTREEIDRLNARELPPVVYADLSGRSMAEGTPIGGYCPRSPDMPHMAGGEVVLHKGVADGVLSENSRARRLRGVYLHEIAHRQVPEEAHGPVFAAVCAALQYRASRSEEATICNIGWYEVQDAENPGAALNHAIEFARAHFDSAATFEELPDLARASWSAYRDCAWKELVAHAEAAGKPALDIAKAVAQSLQAQARRLSMQSARDAARADQAEIRLAQAIRCAQESETLPWSHIWLIAGTCLFIGALASMALAR